MKTVVVEVCKQESRQSSVAGMSLHSEHVLPQVESSSTCAGRQAVLRGDVCVPLQSYVTAHSACNCQNAIPVTSGQSVSLAALTAVARVVRVVLRLRSVLAAEQWPCTHQAIALHFIHPRIVLGGRRCGGGVREGAVLCQVDRSKAWLFHHPDRRLLAARHQVILEDGLRRRYIGCAPICRLWVLVFHSNCKCKAIPPCTCEYSEVVDVSVPCLLWWL